MTKYVSFIIQLFNNKIRRVDHRRMLDEVLNPVVNEEMELADENHVVVVGLAAVGNRNGELEVGQDDDQVEVEAENAGVDAFPGA